MREVTEVIVPFAARQRSRQPTAHSTSYDHRRQQRNQGAKRPRSETKRHGAALFLLTPVRVLVVWLLLVLLVLVVLQVLRSRVDLEPSRWRRLLVLHVPALLLAVSCPL